jgi:hypothetical protein
MRRLPNGRRESSSIPAVPSDSDRIIALSSGAYQLVQLAEQNIYEAISKNVHLLMGPGVRSELIFAPV